MTTTNGPAKAGGPQAAPATDAISALVPKGGTFVARFGDAADIRLKLQIMRSQVASLSKKKSKKVGENDDAQWVETDEYMVSDELVVALVLFEMKSGLSAARGECGVIAGQGLYVATKVKVADAMAFATKNHDPITPEFIAVTPTDLGMWAIAQRDYGAELGDTVVAVRIGTYQRERQWRAARLSRYEELERAGIRGREGLDVLDEEFGKTAPPMVAFGVVKGSENFAGGDADGGESRWRPRDPKKAAKWDEKQANKKGRQKAVYSEHDRACKRAFSRALAMYGLSAPDQRDYGAAGKYLVAEDAQPTSLLASATNSAPAIDENAELRRAELVAEITAAGLVGSRANPAVAARVFGSGPDADLLEGYKQPAQAKAEDPPAQTAPPTFEEMTADLRGAITFDASGKPAFNRDACKRLETVALYTEYVDRMKNAYASLGDTEPLALSGWRIDWRKVDAGVLASHIDEMKIVGAHFLDVLGALHLADATFALAPYLRDVPIEALEAQVAPLKAKGLLVREARALLHKKALEAQQQPA